MSGADERITARTGDRRAIRLVAGRELTEALRRKAVWATAAAFFLVSTAAVLLPDLLGGRDDAERTVALVGDEPVGLEAQLVRSAPMVEIQLTLERPEDLDTAVAAVREGDLDALVRFDTDPATLVVDDDRDQRLLALLRESIQVVDVTERLTAAGLDPDQIGTVLTPVVPSVEVLDTERGGRQLVSVAAALVMYLVLVILAMQIASAVAVEKSSRVSEVLLAVASPRALLFGKVIGIATIGLLTLTAGAIPVAVRLASGGSLPPGTGVTIAVALAFSILGITLYLCLAGALGALVERTEEVNSTVGPLTAVLIIGYLIGQVASDTPIGAALAYFPLTSPMVMPARVALDAASALDVAVSLLLLAAAVIAASRFATVVYRRAIVRTGRRLRLREVLGRST